MRVEILVVMSATEGARYRTVELTLPQLPGDQRVTREGIDLPAASDRAR